MRLSVVIPAHNEEGSLAETVISISTALLGEAIEHEIIVVNDHSSDGTAAILDTLEADVPGLRVLENTGPGGFGYAVRFGLERFDGDCVAVMMA
ncbi:MAG TPA: glycosyltransferase family 2 protein, partial [Flavobacteriales bacterium]|nr:glycosyltransferase family 2 protein [Flavobacteriales bacterium]